MSGFLTTLLRKERIPALSLRPRVGSRFEPLAPAMTSEPDPVGGWPGGVGAENEAPLMAGPEPPLSAPTPGPSRPHTGPSAPGAGSLLPGEERVQAGMPEPCGENGLEKAASGGERASTRSSLERPAGGASGMQTDGQGPKAGSGGTERGAPSPDAAPGRAAEQTGQALGGPPGPRSNIEAGEAPEWPGLQGQGAFPHTFQAGGVRRASALRGTDPEEGIQQSGAGVSSPRGRASDDPAAHGPFVETAAIPANRSAADLDSRRPAPRAEPMGGLRRSAHHGQHSPGSVLRGRGEAQSHAPSPSLAIRVSIGRIEVRAQTPARVMPQPAPPKSSPYRPPLTLDDYLKKRSGGS
jgi:hypothetical protein